MATRLSIFVCFAATATLVAGTDLSAFNQVPASPLAAESGDTVTLDIHGWLDNGTSFMDNRSLVARIGDGSLVAGLDDGLAGLVVGTKFNLTVDADQGYGALDPSRITNIARIENLTRTFTVPLSEFENQIGPPYKGEVVHTRVWDSVVVSTGDPVILSYQPKAGQLFQLYRYWKSRVNSFDNETIFAENLLHVGDQIPLAARQGQATRVVRVTHETPGSFTLDSNSPLAGQRLHFQGRLLALRAGTGIRRNSGMASSLGARDCASCHGGAGFNAVSAQASAVQQGGQTIVNVTVNDPWLHDVRDITVTATVGNVTFHGKATTKTMGPLGSDASTDLQFILPGAPARANVDLVINATAHHAHQSGGKPDDLPYQLSMKVPVGAPRQAPAAIAPRTAVVRALDITGRLTGFGALVVLGFPAVQGYRRHLRKKPLLRVPPWLTTHLSFSLMAIGLTFVHAETLMSGKWHGNWSWGVSLGAVALCLMGVMGFTGLYLAGWSKTRRPRLRRWHYVLMVALVVVSLIHTVAISSDLSILRGS